MNSNENLNQLGWIGIDKDSAEICELRQHLINNNGIKGLEILQPDQIEDAVRIFYRDGFVVIKDVLDTDQLDFIRAGCDRVIREMMALDKQRLGNRGSHRYSFGGASLTGHLMHHPEWAMLADLATVTPILTAIFDSANYICRGGGGDFCLPGAVQYQPLHSDISDRTVVSSEQGDPVTYGSFKDPRGLMNYRDLPCPYIACNYLMVDFTQTNGPIRQIPGTQSSHEPIPRRSIEPEWMKLSTLCPAPAGSVVIRDPRAWHGGTPNLSDEIRALPNAEYYAPWFREPMNRNMPRDIYDTLSDHGKQICQFIVAEKDEVLATGYQPGLGLTPQVMRKQKTNHIHK